MKKGVRRAWFPTNQSNLSYTSSPDLLRIALACAPRPRRTVKADFTGAASSFCQSSLSRYAQRCIVPLQHRGVDLLTPIFSNKKSISGTKISVVTIGMTNGAHAELSAPIVRDLKLSAATTPDTWRCVISRIIGRLITESVAVVCQVVPVTEDCGSNR